MSSLRLTLVQSTLHWENIAANLEMFDQKISSLTEETDLIILPEMFSTGFSMKPAELAEIHGGQALQQMKKWADQKNAAICGSLIVSDNGKYFNRLYFVKPGGEIVHYDKRHLFRMAGEHEHYHFGSEKIIVNWRGWKICPLVCYDLRFPVWSRNRWNNGQAEYDLLIYVANWPARRSHPWKSLLTARAIENIAYVAGINRVGEDGNKMDYQGDSSVTDFKGEKIVSLENGEEKTVTVTLYSEALSEFRNSFPAWRDADFFSVT